MSFRPAGLSDDDNDSLDDSDDELNNQKRRHRLAAAARQTNGRPKTIRESILQQNIEALRQHLDINRRKNISIDYDQVSHDIPLIVACETAWTEGVQLLLEEGANPNTARELLTPLAACCMKNVESSVSCVKLLLSHCADPNRVDKYGRTPLMIAASAGNCSVVEYLLDCMDVDIHAKDPYGWTALFFAKEKGEDRIMDLLIRAGLDPEAKAQNGESLLDIQCITYREESSCDITVLQLLSGQLPPVSHNAESFIATRSRQNVESFLSYLPNNEGSGGFSDLVNGFLDRAGYENLVLGDAHLDDILIGDVGLLEKLGVKFSAVRNDIARGVHDFHLQKWGNSSLPWVPSSGEVNLELIGNTLSANLQHLVAIKAALIYLQRRVDAAPGGRQGASKLAETCAGILQAERSIKKRLSEIAGELKKLRSIEDCPIDYVGPRSLKSSSALECVKASSAFYFIFFGVIGAIMAYRYHVYQ